MDSIKFIHCADLHIDSPFKGIGEVNSELKDILYNSTFKSFQNIVNLAITNKVHCVLIAGDVYDGADKSLKAQLRFRDELERLSVAGIPSFIVAGNHDPLDSWSASIDWPKIAYFFKGDKVVRQPLVLGDKKIADIYGISFPKRDVSENLALHFERENDRIPSIAILHTNIGENTGHKPYAPATIDDLKSRKMDYWALGHVHTPKILNENHPTIHYPGNSQARNPREIGSKGCSLVVLKTDGDCTIKHISTDVVRYQTRDIDISGLESLDDVIDMIKNTCETVWKAMEGRHAIIRLTLQGRSNINDELRKGDNLSDLVDSVRETYIGRDPIICLEKVALNTTSVYDIEKLRDGNDFVADIISLYDEIECKEKDVILNIRDIIKPLTDNWGGSKHLEKLSDAEILDLAKNARDWTLDQIVGGE